MLNLTIEAQEPQLLEPAQMLSSTPPFPWSRPVWEGRKCVFNFVPSGDAFERAFTKFLDGASDVKAFGELPEVFGFAVDVHRSQHESPLVLPGLRRRRAERKVVVPSKPRARRPRKSNARTKRRNVGAKLRLPSRAFAGAT